MSHKLIKISNRLIISRNKGLTLIELMVVIAIFMIITTIAIFNYSNFNSTVSLQNLTDDIALSIRKAQSFAIGARAIKENESEVDFTKRYGMHFSVDESPENNLSGSDKSFLMFSVSVIQEDKEYTADSSTDCGSISNECIELFNIRSIDKVEKIIAYDGVGGIVNDSNSSSVDILFTRPDPRAIFCYKEFSTSSCNYSISKVDIILSNNRDAPYKRIKTISVQNTGQISIQ